MLNYLSIDSRLSRPETPLGFVEIRTVNLKNSVEEEMRKTGGRQGIGGENEGGVGLS